MQKKFLLSVALLIQILLYQKSVAQNLIANEGLEDINLCTEYHANCAPEAWFYIKPTTNPVVNGRVVPKPLLGTNMLLVPVHNVFGTEASRSYVYTMLLCPLQKGQRYRLTFFINTAKRNFYNLDFYFSEKEPASHNYNTYGLKPSFSITQQQIVADMKQAWKAVEYEFTASGNEQFCMLGNLSETMNYEIADRMNASGYVFYFLDDIKLMPISGQQPCADIETNRKKIYDQNYRHSEFVLVDPELAKPKPPVFVSDTITVPAAFFKTGSAVLMPSFTKLMDSVAIKFSGKKIAKIDITGHTDDRGTLTQNETLSLARAKSVQQYFVEKFPQYNDIIFASGKGPAQPVADNKTETGRAKNRRVEIVLTILESVR